MTEARVGTLGDAPAMGGVRRRGTLASGIASGLVAGAVMAAFMVAAASLAGLPRFHVLDVLGDTFVGLERLDGMAEIAFGAAIHLLVAAVAGLAFAAVVPRDLPLTCAIVVGMGYALFLAGLMTSLVVPPANPDFREGMQPLGGSFVIAHVLYGAVLGGWFGLAGRAGRSPAAAR